MAVIANQNTISQKGNCNNWRLENEIEQQQGTQTAATPRGGFIMRVVIGRSIYVADSIYSETISLRGDVYGAFILSQELRHSCAIERV